MLLIVLMLLMADVQSQEDSLQVVFPRVKRFLNGVELLPSPLTYSVSTNFRLEFIEPSASEVSIFYDSGQERIAGGE